MDKLLQRVRGNIWQVVGSSHVLQVQGSPVVRVRCSAGLKMLFFIYFINKICKLNFYIYIKH